MRTEPVRRGSSFRVLVAPVAGRLRLLPPTTFRNGREWVDEGQPVALIERGTGAVEVRAPMSGGVAAVLGLEGEPVVAGQALLAIDVEEG